MSASITYLPSLSSPSRRFSVSQVFFFPSHLQLRILRPEATVKENTDTLAYSSTFSLKIRKILCSFVGSLTVCLILQERKSSCYRYYQNLVYYNLQATTDPPVTVFLLNSHNVYTWSVYDEPCYIAYIMYIPCVFLRFCANKKLRRYFDDMEDVL